MAEVGGARAGGSAAGAGEAAGGASDAGDGAAARGAQGGGRRDLVREAAERAPEGLALDAPDVPGGAWTWRELDARVDRAAGGLAVAGVRAGAVVALLLPPGADAVESLHALARLGATAAPLNPAWTAAELAAALDAVAADLLVCDASTAARAGEATSGTGRRRVPLLRLPGPGVEGQPRDAGGRFPGLSPGQPLAVLRTSGTTGRPRPVELTLGNLLAIARGSRERLDLGPDDRWYGVLSPAHVGGLALLVRAAALGSTVVARPSFDPGELVALAGEGRVSHASLVPTMLHRVLERTDAAPAALRCLLVGGAPTPAGLLTRALEAGYPVALTYGLTEASSQVATAPPELVREKPGTVGPPLPGVEVRISEDGEVLVRGPTVARGRGPGGPGDTGRGEGGAEAEPGGGPAVDDEGWLHTGDLGRLDGDGHLWITGRRSDRIVSGGVTVEPGEVEAVLRLHEDVGEAAVVGVPDREWGEVVSAAVTALPGRSLDPEALERHARAHLSGSRVPRRVVVVEEIPRNPNGKVDRDGVVALFS